MTRDPPSILSPEQLQVLHDAAADWVARRQQPGWTAADESALDAWLAGDPLHRSSFDGVDRTWLDSAPLQPHDPQGSADPAPEANPAPPVPSPVPRPAPRSRWASLVRDPVFACVLLAGCAMLAAGGWYRWQHTVQFALDATTSPGETRVIALPDGSRLALNLDSAVQVRFYPYRRSVTLERGEVFFEVAADADKPFTIDSGRSELRVVGTAFNVRAAPQRLVVKVLEGQVEVHADRTAQPGQVLLLGAESGVAIDTATGVHHSVIANAEAIGDWRTGQLQFSRVPLAEVADELARYLGHPVTLASPQLALLLVSGVLLTEAPERFLQALPERMAVQVQLQSDGSWYITAKR